MKQYHDEIRKLYDDGLSYRAIERQLGLSNGYVSYWAKKNNVKSKLRHKPPIAIDDEHSLCSKCSEVVANKDFPWVQNSKDGRKLSYCRKCRYLQIRTSAVNNPEQYLKERCKRIGERAKRANIEFNITKEDLIDIWYKQKGLCFYTDIVLQPSVAEGRAPNNPSVDRVDSTKGYVIGNLVICSSKANSIKQDMTFAEMKLWTPEWYRRLNEAGFIQ